MIKFKRSLLTIGIPVFVIVSIWIAFHYMEPTKMLKKPMLTTQFVDLKVNDFEYKLDFHLDNQTLYVGTLNSDRFNTISIGKFEGYDISINDIPITSESEIKLKLKQLSKSEPIVIKIHDLLLNQERKYYISTLPENYSNMIITSSNPEHGFYYFNLNDYIYKMDTNGKIVFWRLAGHGDVSCGGDDFKRTEIDGKVYYSFLYGGEWDGSPYLTGVGYGRMKGMILNEDYQVIDGLWLLTQKDGTQVPLENHQLTVLGDKHYLLTAYVGKRVTNIPENVAHSKFGTRVVATIIQEIKDGKVIFEWDSTDHPELYGISSAGNDFYNLTDAWADYAHLNSIAVDPKDQNLICSFRNLDTVLKIDRTNGNILWKLGGKGDDFGLQKDQLFSKQHDARLTKDGAITIFNDGNSGNSFTEGRSSIKKFYLNEKNKSLSQYENYDLEGQFTSCMGSAQEVKNQRYVIGWGCRVTQLPLFSEIDFSTNQVLFECYFPMNEGDYPNAYKVYKFDK